MLNPKMASMCGVLGKTRSCEPISVTFHTYNAQHVGKPLETYSLSLIQSLQPVALPHCRAW